MQSTQHEHRRHTYQNMALISRHRGIVIAVLTPLLLAIVVAGAGPVSAATTIETMPLWRLQVRITTGSTATAGTNGTPAVRLNASTTGVRTLNPPSTTAFHAGHIDSYDLRLLATPSEITMLRVGIGGTDDWCVRKVELLFNGRVAFAQDAVPGGACATISGGTYVQYSSAALRSNPAWTGYGTPPPLPTGMSAVDLRALVTAVSGSAMLSDPRVFWDSAVSLDVVRITSSTVRVSFGIGISDGVDFATQRVTYDVRLYVGTDGTLHATETTLSKDDLHNAVVAQLDTALSRMSVRPTPHDPLRFGVDAGTNIAWSYARVVVG